MLKTGIRKYDIFKTYYWHDAIKSGPYRFPQLEPTHFIPHDVIGFNERNRVHNPRLHWLDFFIDDCLFECFWNQMDNYIDKIRQFEGVITTDYSMLPELLPAQNLWNCTRNRIAAYKLQQEGINIIPTASWSCLKDFDWCLDGLPKDSSIAISTNGSKSTPYGERIFTHGVDILQEKIYPKHLIICGRKMPGLQEKYNNIIYYPSFSQRWKEREKNG